VSYLTYNWFTPWNSWNITQVSVNHQWVNQLNTQAKFEITEKATRTNVRQLLSHNVLSGAICNSRLHTYMYWLHGTLPNIMSSAGIHILKDIWKEFSSQQQNLFNVHSGCSHLSHINIYSTCSISYC
jgi:hypothetical protein